MSDGGGELWGALGAAAAAVVSSGLTLLVTRKPAAKTAQAAEVTADAAWQGALNDGFAKLNAQYDARNRELMQHVLRLEHSVSGLSQHLLDLEDLLRKLGHPIPERPATAWPPAEFHVLQGGKS